MRQRVVGEERESVCGGKGGLYGQRIAAPDCGILGEEDGRKTGALLVGMGFRGGGWRSGTRRSGMSNDHQPAPQR